MAVGLRASASRHPFRGGWLFLVPLACLGSSWPAWAEDRELGEVTSEGNAEPDLPAEAKDPTAFSTTIERRPGEGSRTSDLVLASPGTVVRNYGLNQPATLSLRGSTSDQVVVLLDGVPLNPASGGGADLSTIPLPLIDRISVVRGALGARYGTGAVGGVVSLETRRVSSGERALSGEVSYGSFQTAQGSTRLAFSASERVSALVGLFASTSQGDFPYSYALRPKVAPDEMVWREQENNQSRRFGALARLSLAGPVEGSALVEVDGGERGLPGSYLAKDFSPEARQGDWRALGAGRLSFSTGGLRLESRVSARFGRLQRGTWSDHGPDQDETQWSAEASASRLWGRHSIELGLAGGREALASDQHGGHERWRFGAFASDEMTWSFLTLLPAVRFERIAQESRLSPKLGASVPVGELVSIKANAGRSYRAPSFGELYLEQGMLEPNPDLKSETGTYVDLGATLRWRRLSFSADAFWSLYDDLILYEVYATKRAKPFNFGRAEVWGGELEGSARYGLLSLAACYTLSFSANRMDKPLYLGKELPGRPRHRLHARTAIEWRRLEAHLEADVQSGHFLNRTNTDSLQGRARFDLGASVVLDQAIGLALHAEVRNLLNSWDMDYYAYRLPGRAFFVSVRFDSLQRSTP
ncbi:MAG: TonB-dependent receptor [Deltaproteobacteria bacterium]|nr:TonB-dependent receptor [Deltaproteobacteria bacterium]